MAIDFATYTERVLGQEIPAIPHTEAEIRWCRIAFDAGANWWEARDRWIRERPRVIARAASQTTAMGNEK